MDQKSKKITGEKLAEIVEKGFKDMEDKFHFMNANLYAVEQKLGLHHEQIKAAYRRFDFLESKVERSSKELAKKLEKKMDNKIDKLAQMVQTGFIEIKNEMVINQTEINKKFENIEASLAVNVSMINRDAEGLTNQVDGIDDRLKFVEKKI